MPNNIYNALIFLIYTVFDFYLFILVIRIVLVWVKAYYYDPVTQFIAKLTDPIIKPLRRIIPNIGSIETSTVLLVIILAMLKFFLLSYLEFGMPNPLGLFVLAIGDSLKILLDSFFFAILFQAIMSWVSVNSNINRVLYQYTAPIMTPLHRIIPLVGGIDITPIPALILLKLIVILLIQPIISVGSSLTVT